MQSSPQNNFEQSQSNLSAVNTVSEERNMPVKLSTEIRMIGISQRNTDMENFFFIRTQVINGLRKRGQLTTGVFFSDDYAKIT